MDKHLSLEMFKDTHQLGEFAGELLLKITFAIAIFYIGKWAAEGLVKLLRLGMRRGRVDETLQDFLANVIYGVLVALVVVTALTQIGVATSSAAALLGGAALAIGLSLQSQLSSLAAGVILILTRPFKKGDYVEIGGVRGFVEEIRIVHTVLRTTDNRELTVPNSSITTQTISNFTARPVRRVDFVIAVGYDADLRRVKQLLQEIVQADAAVLKAPPPVVEVAALGASSVDFNVQPWVRTTDHWDLKSALLEAIKLRFDAEGIVIPHPQMEVQLRQAAQPPSA